ncbi:MAG TPA: hypothetical protein VK612_00230 [Pyrinomonadaceae bacterium]|nr:hypothetical protein [Pyrinomonadaceae bacterium]
MAEGVLKGIVLVVILLAVQFTVGFLILKYLDEVYLLVEGPLFVIFIALVLKLFYQKDISN